MGRESGSSGGTPPHKTNPRSAKETVIYVRRRKAGDLITTGKNEGESKTRYAKGVEKRGGASFFGHVLRSE